MFEESWTSEASRKKWPLGIENLRRMASRKKHAVSLNNDSCRDEPLINASLDKIISWTFSLHVLSQK